MNIKRINMILIGLATFLIIIIVVMQVQDLSSKGVMVVKYSHDSARDSLHNKTALKFKRIVETQTEGKIQVEVYPEGELGSGSRMFKAVEKGIQEIALLPTATISREEPSLEILDLPYLFQDRESAYKILDGKIGDEILSSIKSNNIIGVQFYEDGFKKFTSNKPINKVEDFKDLKFRIMPSKILLEQYKCLGAQGIEVDFNNTYRFLESNILDGQENPLISIEDMNYKKV
ncbi:MAG: TRAP transporter substrate-binding protein, partial [Clostridium sp.]